ncbi:MAG: IS1634 family transposase [Lachnospiraceae bacterium]|nr:IS1634 family transposase [Lachnospiraceae bacterium]
MYLYKQKTKKGDVYLAIKEKYHIPGVGGRDKTIEKIGYLSELKKTMEDPIAYYSEYAKRLTEESKRKREQVITIDLSEKLEIGSNDSRNVGYGILKWIYKELELDKFWNWKTRGLNVEFSTDQIFRLLVFARALNPGSKRYTLRTKDFFFEPFDDISEDDIYHALDIIAENKDALQEWIFKKSGKIIDRDLSVAYFDCTNYYFEIDRPDVDLLNEDGSPVDENGNPVPAKYRKRGPEKNRRPDPIVGMGLLLDRNSVPVAYDLFPGNESEKVHMRPIINRVKNNMDCGRIIFVADRGLNTSDNIYWLNGDNKGDNNQRDGYVYGQTVRGADEEFREWVLQNDYIIDRVLDDDGNEIAFKHKSRCQVKELHVNVPHAGTTKTKKKTVRVDQKQMVYYSEKYAKKQKADRETMIARAKDLIRHPQKYDRITAKGSSSYILNISFDKTTGEVVSGKNLLLNLDKIAEEEKYDGYYSIVTSELNMSDLEMREIYRGLIRIENTFQVTKSILESRPVYVRLNEHIDAHFATCYMALVLIRLLEIKLDHAFPVGRILDSLKSYNCVHIGRNEWQFTYYDEIIDACAKAFGADLNNKYLEQLAIRRLLRY